MHVMPGCTTKLGSWLVAALLVFLATLASATSIVGRVWIDNRPATHVQVSLQSEMGQTLAQTFTDNDGRFSFGELDKGDYVVSVALSGYQPARELVDGSREVGEEYVVSLFLHPLVSKKKNIEITSPSLITKAQTSFQTGHQLLQQQRFREAIAPLSAATAAQPNLAAAYDDLGTAYFGAGNLSAAEKSWQQALRLDPRLGSAAINLARLANDRHDTPRATVLLDSAQKAGADAWPYHLERGRAAYAMKNWPVASRELNVALQKGASAQPAIYIMLANLNVKAGELPQARRMFEAYIAAAPNGQFAPRAREIVQQMIAKGVPEPPR